jgi:hypothetical protein
LDEAHANLSVKRIKSEAEKKKGDLFS